MNKVLKTSLVAILFSGSVQAAETHDTFFDNLSALCGQKFQAEVVEGNASDDTWRNSVIIMDVANCSDDRIAIPLSVGSDASRTWIITKTGQGLTLKHDHRHEDGTPDAVTLYGGTTAASGSATNQEFPADAYSKALFNENGLDVSVNNTWVLMINAEKGGFSYRLQRPGRTFQIDFDLAKPVS